MLTEEKKVGDSDRLEQETVALGMLNMGYTNYCIRWIKILILEIFSKKKTSGWICSCQHEKFEKFSKK